MTPWVIGNWKLNPASINEVQTLVADLTASLKADSQSNAAANCHLMIAPSFLHLSTAQAAIAAESANIKLASQDVSALSDTTGAYTGDVSVAQLNDLGVQWSIIGHSERRQYYAENNEALLQKLANCAAHNIGSVFCIGESEADFEADNTEQILAEQLEVVADFFKQLGESAADYTSTQFIVAYEPVWAIGTGKVPSIDDVAKVHAFIRQRLQSFDSALATTPIIYGGSVKPENAHDFAALDVVDGVLVGGAALKAQSFIDIAKSFGA